MIGPAEPENERRVEDLLARQLAELERSLAELGDALPAELLGRAAASLAREAARQLAPEEGGAFGRPEPGEGPA